MERARRGSARPARQGTGLAIDADRFRTHERAVWDQYGLSPDERVLDLARVGSRVRVQEVGDGPPVVFVHGASNSGTSWASLVAELDGFRCVLVDRPGCGLSPPLARRFDDVDHLARFADAFVVDVLDAIGADGAAVVATSFGGHLALRGAAAHPERLTHVVELGWPIGAPIGPIPLVMRLASVPWLGRLGTRLPATPRMVRSLLSQVGLRAAIASGAMSDQDIALFRSLLRDTDTMRNELAAGPRLLTLRGMNETILLPSAVLEGVVVPTLLVWGEDDPFGGRAVAERFTALLPQATLEVVAGGHAVWIDDPAGVGARVRSFLVG